MKEIVIKNSGYITCNSGFYSVLDLLDEETEDCFHNGVNLLHGEIDSGIFGVSYLISMYDSVDKETLFLPHIARVDNELLTLSELTTKASYMDGSYGLFNTKKPVKKLVERGLTKYNLPYSTEDIREMFFMEKFRFESPICATGNERFNAMAAIGFANNKEIFCFPWMSQRRFECFSVRLNAIFEVLNGLGKVTIVPLGKI